MSSNLFLTGPDCLVSSYFSEPNGEPELMRIIKLMLKLERF